jgi:hypothetical protein
MIFHSFVVIFHGHKATITWGSPGSTMEALRTRPWTLIPGQNGDGDDGGKQRRYEMKKRYPQINHFRLGISMINNPFWGIPISGNYHLVE